MAVYSQAQVDDAFRKILTPSYISVYIADGDEVASPVLVINTPTKYNPTMTVRHATDFEAVDLGAGSMATKYTGAKSIVAEFQATFGMITSSNNMVVKFIIYKNGVEVPGFKIPRKVGTGADVGALGLIGTLDMVTNDYLEIFVETDVAGSVTLFNMNAIIKELA